MPPPDEDAAELLAVVRSFVLAELAPGQDDEERIDRSRLSRLVGAGLWSIGLPEAVGGQGADASTTLRVIRELAAASPSIAMAVVHTHAVGQALVAAGAENEARRAAEGEVSVLVFAPADSTVDEARVDLGLQPDRVVVVESEPAVTVLPVAVLPDAAPVRRCGLTGLGTRRLVLEAASWANVDQRWIGAPAASAAAVAAAWWRLGTTACTLGTAAGALERARTYVGTRHQFGAPLAQLPTIARALTEIGRDLDLAGAAVLEAAARAGTLSPDLARHAANVAVRGCLESVQLLGGYGYLTEYAVEGLLRDAVSLRAAARLAP